MRRLDTLWKVFDLKVLAQQASILFPITPSYSEHKLLVQENNLNQVKKFIVQVLSKKIVVCKKMSDVCFECRLCGEDGFWMQAQLPCCNTSMHWQCLKLWMKEIKKNCPKCDAELHSPIPVEWLRNLNWDYCHAGDSNKNVNLASETPSTEGKDYIVIDLTMSSEDELGEVSAGEDSSSVENYRVSSPSDNEEEADRTFLCSCEEVEESDLTDYDELDDECLYSEDDDECLYSEEDDDVSDEEEEDEDEEEEDDEEEENEDEDVDIINV